MVTSAILIIFMIIITVKILFDIYYLGVSKKFVNEKCNINITKKVDILLIIPVLREQSIIESTLDHFLNMKLDNIRLHACIAGTSRECNGREMNYISTGCVVETWIKNNEKKFSDDLIFSYAEAIDENGDRATQLNYAVKQASKLFVPDVVGVYDADSLPDIFTLEEVASEYCCNSNTVFQQPVHFINSANRMANQGKNPILVANALYQTTWTAIRELPRWKSHSKYNEKNGKRSYLRNDYLIGHGEFMPFKIYEKYIFPEREVTDGIQLGYRVSMSGVSIKPLHTFCIDDVPKSVGQIIGQHKRWFGGCNRLWSAYKWSKNNCGQSSVFQMIDGYWSQLSWTYASLYAIISLILSIVKAINGNSLFLIIMLIELFIYCYLIPFVSNNLIPEKIKIRVIDWLCLPLAIGIKGIGPNIYLIQKMISIFRKKEIKYSKVER